MLLISYFIIVRAHKPHILLHSSLLTAFTITGGGCVVTGDINDAESRLLVFDAEPRLSFSVKKNESEPRL